MALTPIWKDIVVNLIAQSARFRILDHDSSVSIYEGSATAKPGEASAKVRINDICADYLENSIPALTDRDFSDLAWRKFDVQVLNSTWGTIGSVEFYNDWSYDYGFPGSGDLSFPINGRVDDRMFIMFSGLEMTSLSASYRRTGGTSTSRSAYTPTPPYSGTGVFKANAVANVEKIVIKSRVYYPVGDCYKYALYYVNAYGGWDQFLIEGNDLETDEVARHLNEVEYDNTDIQNRGVNNYVSEITKSWTLHTGLLTDDEASRMHHLLNSNLVYLYNIPTGELIPVTMQTNTCEYKTFKNQGRRMVEYTIQVELAQNRIRR